MKSNVRDVEVIYHHQTEKAVKIAADETTAPEWLPKSVIEMDPADPVPGQVVTITAPISTLQEKGFL